MIRNRILRITAVILGVLLLAGIFQFVFTLGSFGSVQKEYRETAEKTQKVIDENEMDQLTQTLQYETYKAALNDKACRLEEGWVISHRGGHRR